MVSGWEYYSAIKSAALAALGMGWYKSDGQIMAKLCSWLNMEQQSDFPQDDYKNKAELKPSEKYIQQPQQPRQANVLD